MKFRLQKIQSVKKRGWANNFTISPLMIPVDESRVKSKVRVDNQSEFKKMKSQFHNFDNVVTLKNVASHHLGSSIKSPPETPHTIWYGGVWEKTSIRFRYAERLKPLGIMGHNQTPAIHHCNMVTSMSLYQEELLKTALYHEVNHKKKSSLFVPANKNWISFQFHNPLCQEVDHKKKIQSIFLFPV